MHTDHTLRILDETTIRIGAEFRDFANKTCPAFNTRELAREVEARKRRHEKKSQGRTQAGDAACHSFPVEQTSDAMGPRPMKFTLLTYKFHALGDYANTIRQFGTTDSYSTESVSSFNHLQGMVMLT
jgi:hypothetical protein